MEPLSLNGPPRNLAHVREWSHDELGAYFSSQGFLVLDVRRNGRPDEKQNTMWFLLELAHSHTCYV